ncbi:unnamed protein product [Polarella glacialis]|uniref:Calmodulin n=1 Tax=Polarella glacialis TaxID=89957 RepID=A0A813FQ52_POLGL|nr:unnamed protein product [Polarella glacialis]
MNNEPTNKPIQQQWCAWFSKPTPSSIRAAGLAIMVATGDAGSAQEVVRRHRRQSLIALRQEDEAVPPAHEEIFDAQDYLRPGITEAEVMEMKASFDLLDHEGTGELDLDDALDTLEALRWDRLEQEPLVVAIRTCKRRDEVVDFAGFLDAMAPLLVVSEPTQDSLRRTWRLLDESRKGSINIEDVCRAVRQFGLELSAEEIADMVNFADRNCNGDVTFDEFFSVLSRQQLAPTGGGR